MTLHRDPAKAEWIAAAVVRYEGRLCRYAARLLGDEERARDAVQETFLRLCAEEPGKVEGHLAEWLFSVCRTRALDRLRKERPMTPISPAQEAVLPSGAAGPAEAAAARETGASVGAALAELPPDQQEAIRLKFQEGLSYREISRITGMPEGTVGYLIHVGIQALRKRLAV